MSNIEDAAADGAFFDPRVEAWPVIVGEMVEGEAVVAIRYRRGERPVVILPFETAHDVKQLVAGAISALRDEDLVDGQYGVEFPTDHHAYLHLRFATDSDGRVLGLVGRSGAWLCCFSITDAVHVMRLLDEGIAQAWRAARAEGIEL